MVNNNIHSKDISPFIKRIFKKDDEYNFKKLIINLPTIPKIYFYNDDITNNIINNYNIIRTTINELRITKDFILSILKTSKIELEKIEIDRDTYFLNSQNLIINFKNDYTETFNDENKFSEFKENYDIKKFFDKKTKFNEFIEKYLDEHNNIFKNIKKDMPYFYVIFQNEYRNNKNKDFFINLLKKFYKIKNSITPNIKSNNGILGFNMVFDLKDNIYLSDVINSEKKILKKNNSKNNNNIDYSKYILNGENIMNNTNNIKKTSVSTTVKPSKKTLTATKGTLKNKIHKYNLLYLEKYNTQYYINLHENNLKIIYDKIIHSINNCTHEQSPNLYNITVNLIELEFSIIEFIFNYIDKNLFENFINTHIKIKEYIYEQINMFDTNYEQYINWYNRVIKEVTDFFDDIDFNDEDYETFYSVFLNIIKNIDIK